MKKIFRSISLKFFITFLIITLGASLGFSEEKRNYSGKYPYTTVRNDPLKARMYKLDNGLTVYMTVYKDAPRIQTYIAVKAGSKNDPAD